MGNPSIPNSRHTRTSVFGGGARAVCPGRESAEQCESGGDRIGRSFPPPIPFPYCRHCQSQLHAQTYKNTADLLGFPMVDRLEFRCNKKSGFWEASWQDVSSNSSGWQPEVKRAPNLIIDYTLLTQIWKVANLIMPRAIATSKCCRIGIAAMIHGGIPK